MRTPPGSIPSILPKIQNVVMDIHETLKRPIVRLGDASLYDLTIAHRGHVWLTGSAVWLTAVFGMNPDIGGDFDLVFTDANRAEIFADSVLRRLNARVGSQHQYTRGSNMLGSNTILHPDGKKVMDCWALGNESIAEMLAAYPKVGDHIKCAYLITETPAIGNLTRLVNIPARKDMIKKYPVKQYKEVICK